MTTPYKLQVKLFGNEFLGEGPEKSVKADYAEWLLAAQQAKQSPPSQNGHRDPPPPAGSVEDATMGRIFAVDNEGGVSLRLLPRTERRDADALMAILYGFRRLSQQDDLGSAPLMDAARTSGLQINRIDTVLAAYRHLVTEGGYRRGKRYGLNNQGVVHAEQVIAGMV